MCLPVWPMWHMQGCQGNIMELFPYVAFVRNILLEKFGQASGLMPIILALWEAKAGRSLEVRSLRPAWPIWWNPVSTKNRKISQAWWCMLTIPATRKLRQENCLNLGGRDCSEQRSCHCTPAWVTEWEFISNNKTTTTTKEILTQHANSWFIHCLWNSEWVAKCLQIIFWRFLTKW